MTQNQASVDRLMASAKLSEAIKKGYMMRVNQYLKAIKMAPDDLIHDAKAHPKKFEEAFIRFLQGVSKNSSSSTTTAFRDSVKRFLEINRVTNVNWTYINEFVPSARRAGQDRAPTLEEIHKILDVADLRMKCLALFLCSSGARIGAVPYLRWRDVEEVEADGQRLAKLTIYRGEPKEYVTFVTPECYDFWLKYRALRERIGEKVGGASYVFSTQANARRFDQSKVKPVSVKTLKNMLGELLQRLGMRSVISERGGYKNYEFKQAHGFRKFFKTRMEMSGVKPIITEMLMGQAIGVAGSYMKPTSEELLGEYSKAIDNLTIVERRTEKADLRNAFREQLLLVAGFEKEEIDRLDLSNTSDEEFQKMVRERLLGAMVNNGARQKVVPSTDVEQHLTQGWEYVAAMADNKVVLRLPS